jgi:cobalamin biosynthesis protein CobD/CbiB
MMAGLLGVHLEKKGVYTLGDPTNPINSQTVRHAWRLVVVASCLASGLCLLGILSIHLVVAYSVFLPLL